MTTVNPCKVLRTGDPIETPKGSAIIHFLYDKEGKQHFDLAMRLIDHAKVKIKKDTITVYPYQMQLKGE